MEIIKKPSYEEAKAAKHILLEYLEADLEDYVSLNDMVRHNTNVMAYFALKQDYFLD